MTEEEAFQRALDANPSDWQTRLVFADWLEERNDPRAGGYRALGLRRCQPVPTNETPGEHPERWACPGYVTVECAKSRPKARALRPGLPGDWHGLIPKWHEGDIEFDDVWRCRKTRREVEDAAALAFSNLPAERRAELLAIPALRKAPRKARKPAAKKRKK
jgi:uncharacterized protein (TIGR02996 family)